jgi:signal transduction histidine kinase
VPEPCTSTDPPTIEELSDVLRDYMDVTTRLQRTHQTLQDEVVRLRQELAGKDRELELRRRLAALGELAAGVAHEVRNPLGAIQLYSGLLRKQCRMHRLEPALRLIEKIDAGIQAIEAVVQDTLALVPRDRCLTPCKVTDILERVRDTTLKTLTVCRVRLDVQSPADDLWVRADHDGLQRVLVNLIVNAAEASPPGRTVSVRVATAGEDQVDISVCDEGPGIPDEIRDRIFDPFFTTKQEGTGLGLTIAHRVIEAYGGRLTARNLPGSGAEFIVGLPRARVCEAAEETGVEPRETNAA